MWERVAYPRARLVVIYVQRRGGVERVFGVLTRRSSYRTADGVGVGSPRVAVNHARGFACQDDPRGFTCNAGRGHERPVIALSGPGTRVTLVMLAAVAD